MSQPSLLHPLSTTPPQNRPPSTKSGKQALGKSLKHAFSRKRLGSLRMGSKNDSDGDLSSQRSGSIGPESFVSNEHSDTRFSEEAVLDSSEPSPPRGRSPSRKVITDPPASSPPRRKSRSLPRDLVPIVISSPLPPTSKKFPTPDHSQERLKSPKPALSLQTSNSVPAMSITPATPINPPSGPSTPDKPARGNLSHQRSWSKLSNSISPVNEEKPSAVPGSVGSGVWGSLVTAANKVTDTISSLTSQGNPTVSQITRSVSAAPPEDNNPNNLTRPRSQTMPAAAAQPVPLDEPVPKLPKQMAIDTLGHGELSLKELGFESDTGLVPRSSDESSMRPKSVQDGVEDGSVRESDSIARPLKVSTADLAVPVEHKRDDNIARSRRSLTVPTRGVDVGSDSDRHVITNGAKQPRRLSSLSKKGNVRRNESVASRASSEAVIADDVGRRARKRSSLATGDSVHDSPKSRAAGTPDVTEDRENEDGLFIHGKDGKKRRVPITGFAVQSGKRNRDFHALFKSVEESDYLIEDYSCALSKEILVQGRMYVSEHYICFNSNIFGWVTNLVIAFTEVVSIEKRSTAVLFPNGIQITTLHAKYVFASFVGRDGTYDLLTSIWRLSHPDSRSPDDPYLDDSESASPSSGSFSDDEASLSDKRSIRDQSNLSEEGTEEDEEGSTKNTSAGSPAGEKKGEEVAPASSLGDTGPESHDKTECDCGKDGHYEKVVCDEVVKAPLGKVWNCVYGENKDFMMSFLRDNQKVTDITFGDWKSGDGAKRERQVSYIKPLNNSMGPKQTKCNITEQVQAQDFNSSCVALTTTTTPDVPSGSSFQVMTKFCMMWAGGPTTRVLITCTIEWSKSSWIKGAIEKGANEGQVSFSKDLLAELRKKLEGGTTGGKRKTNGKKKGGKRKKEELKDAEKPPDVQKGRSGIFGRFQEAAESTADVMAPVLKPLFSSTCLISVLLLMVFYALIRVERTMRTLSAKSILDRAESAVDLGFGHIEQSALWDWIDTRVASVSKEERDGRLIWNNLANDGIISERGIDDVEEAIRTTEGKLNALKAAVEKSKA